MSGRKNFLPPYLTVSNASMAAEIISPVTAMTELDNISMQAVFSGSPTGTMTTEGSLDKITWNAFTTLAITGAGSELFDLNQLSFPYVRLHYVPTSGTGTLNVLVSGKMV